jgi:hypothetical protein
LDIGLNYCFIKIKINREKNTVVVKVFGESGWRHLEAMERLREIDED